MFIPSDQQATKIRKKTLLRKNNIHMERSALRENISRFCSFMHIYIYIYYLCVQAIFFSPKKSHFATELKRGK